MSSELFDSVQETEPVSEVLSDPPPVVEGIPSNPPAEGNFPTEGIPNVPDPLPNPSLSDGPFGYPGQMEHVGLWEKIKRWIFG